jgi:hypothetical protein
MIYRKLNLLKSIWFQKDIEKLFQTNKKKQLPDELNHFSENIA